MLNQIKNTEAFTALEHKGQMPLMNQINGWAYARSKYAPDEIRNSMFLPPEKKALMDAKTSLLLILLFYPLMSVMPQEQMLFRGAENSTPDEKFLPPSKKRICPWWIQILERERERDIIQKSKALWTVWFYKSYSSPI